MNQEDSASAREMVTAKGREEQISRAYDNGVKDSKDGQTLELARVLTSLRRTHANQPNYISALDDMALNFGLKRVTTYER